MKIATVLGTRPQFVKALPVSRAFSEHAGMTEILIHTGQHFDPGMSEVFFQTLGLPDPLVNLGIHGGSHAGMTGRMLMALEPVLVDMAPDAVLVYGDTNSSLAGALAAVKLGLPVLHVEAGLRSGNRAMPEETNRILIDHVSRGLYCPTRQAVDNLAREGIADGVVHVGDVMFDAALLAGRWARERSSILGRLGLEPGRYGVATVHRAENTDRAEALAEVVAYLRTHALEAPVVLPLHPRTATAAKMHGISLEGLTLCAPLDYLDMTRLVMEAALVLTDSGGLQKEAYFHRVPCVTLRGETEWGETVESGWNRLWKGPDYAPRRAIDDYGDGRAAQALVGAVAGLLSKGR